MNSEVSLQATVMDCLNHSTFMLKDKRIPEARLNSELMLCEVLNCDRIKLYLDFEKPLSKTESEKFMEYVNRRVNNEPLQYILGKSHFYGLEFSVDNNVLIPRQETELLVEKIIEDIETNHKTEVSVFEIGTGSGCISISLAKHFRENKIAFDIFSIDISEAALLLAGKNLKKNLPSENKIRFYRKDVFEIKKLNRDFDYIVSNPPYISAEEFEKTQPEVRLYEPASALTDFKDGTSFYDRIFMIASNRDFTGKVFCETGFDTMEKIQPLLLKYDLKNYNFYKDYSGIDRILKITKS